MKDKTATEERRPDCTTIAIMDGERYKRYHYEADLVNGRFEKDPRLFFIDLRLLFIEAAEKRGKTGYFEQLQKDYHGRH